MRHIVHTDINYADLFADFRDPNSGAVVMFSGEVRDNNKLLHTWNTKLTNRWQKK
jgi:molybdopterin synthase catalytic subunit